VTVVLAGVAVWSGLDTQKNPGTAAVKAQCVGLGTSCPAYQDGLSKERRTDGLWIGTAAVGVLTGVAAAFFVDWGGEPSPPAQGSLRIRPLAGATPSGASLGVSGDF
jgi:hypothetical protein